MKRTFTLVKNFRAYAIVAGLFFVAGASNAQVVKTDVNITKSQTTDGSSSVDIDLNNDGTDDFSAEITKFTDFTVDDITTSSVSINVFGLEEGCTVAVTNAVDELAISFDPSESISSSITDWSDFGTLHSKGTATFGGGTFPFNDGEFENSTGKFVGVRIVVGSNTYYGYIGVNTTDNSVTVRDFAYEKTPNTAISAGALSTGLSSYLESNTTIKNINNTIVAEFKNQFNGKIEVVNMNGQVVKTASVSGTSTSVSMENTPSGIYQVVVSGSEGFATEKVFVAAK